MQVRRFALIYPSFTQWGGAEQAVLNGIRALSEAGHEVTLFTSAYDTTRYPPITMPRVHLVEMGGYGFMEGIGGTIRQVRLLSRLLRGFDLVIASSFPAHLWATLGDHGVPVVWWCMEPKRNLYPAILYEEAPGFGAHAYRTTHNYSGLAGIIRLIRHDPHVLLPYPVRAFGQRLLDQRAVARTAAIWTISPYMASKIAHIYRGRQAEIVWVGVSMPDPVMRVDQEAIFLVTTRLEPIKNAATVLHAAALLGNRLAQIRLVVVGDGSELDSLRALASNLGITNRVLFTGHIPTDARNDWYARCLCVIYPALAEPLGLPCIEAALMARAVIADRRGGPADLITDHETGVLVDMTVPRQLADAMLSILDDPDRAHSMGQNAFARASGMFTLSAWRDQFTARALAACQSSRS